MMLDKLIEYCDRPEHIKAFPNKEFLESYICYFLKEGIYTYYANETGEIEGVGFGRLISTLDDLDFKWQEGCKQGDILAIDVVCISSPEARASFQQSFYDLVRNFTPSRFYMMRRGTWKKLTKRTLRKFLYGN